MKEIFSDAKADRAKRAHELINIHYLANGTAVTGKWVAIRLSDGGSDGKLYPSKPDARRFQLHPQQCAYLCLQRSHAEYDEIKVYLDKMEELYNNGYDLSDPQTNYLAGR